MKLSQLKQLIADVEAARVEGNPDPDVQFWVPRTERHPPAGRLESYSFIDFEIDASDEMKAHRIDAVCRDVVQQRGDFTLPLIVVPFYQEH